MATDNDHWCTTRETFDFCRGVADAPSHVDFDPASNAASEISAAVSYAGSDVCGPELQDFEVASAHTLSSWDLWAPVRGGRLLARSGLEHAWPAWAEVWCNPPYSNPTPFVGQALVHLLVVSLPEHYTRGQLLVPNNAFECVWGQALLWAVRYSRGERVCLEPLERLRDSRHNVAPVSKRLAAAITELRELWGGKLARQAIRPVASLTFFSRRLSFKDPDTGRVATGNRGGSMLFTWGRPVACPISKGQTL